MLLPLLDRGVFLYIVSARLVSSSIFIRCEFYSCDFVDLVNRVCLLFIGFVELSDQSRQFGDF